MAELLDCLEKDIFMNGLLREQEDMEQHGPWGMIVAVTTLAFQCREDVHEEFMFLRGVINEVMGRSEDMLHTPSAKFRALLRYLVDNSILDRFFSAMALIVDDGDYCTIIRGFYSETIFLSKNFMQLLVKVSVQARVIPIRTNMTGNPYIVNHSNTTTESDTPGLDVGVNIDVIEMKMDPHYHSKVRQRGKSIDMTIAMGDISLGTVFGEERDKDKGSAGRSPPSSSSPSSLSLGQRAASPSSITARVMMDASPSDDSDEEGLIAELLLVLADLRMNQENLASSGDLERKLLSGDTSAGLNRSRNSSFNSELASDGDLEHDDREQVKWVKEQIKARAWSIAPSNRIPLRISGTPELLRALLESLLLLRLPLMGSENLGSFQLVMDIPDLSARVRNVALLVAQAPSPSFPILIALLRLFNQLVRDNEVSLPSACMCLCPLLFCTHRSGDSASESSSLFFFRGGSTEKYGSHLRHPEVLAQSSRSLYIVEFLLGHTEEVLAICESNR